MSDETGTRNLLVLLLASVGAAVDTASYVGLGRVFTANMTGNTVQLGIALAHLDTPAITRSSGALAGYVLGVAGGALIVRRPHHTAWSHAITATLALEALIIGIALALWVSGPAPTDHSPIQFALIALLALAMGAQSAAVNALAITGVATTYISGTLTTMVTRLVYVLCRVETSASQPPAPSPWLTLGVWLVYIGAVVASTSTLSVGVWLTLGAPIGVLLVVIGIARVRFRN